MKETAVSLKKNATKPKKKYNVKPSAKALQVAKLMSENIGMSKGEAMRLAGYSESTSKTPQRLTDQKSWNELMDEKLPEELVVETHKGLLTAMALDHQSFATGFRTEAEKMMYIEDLKNQYKNAKDEQPEEEEDDLNEDDEDAPKKKKRKYRKKLKTKEEVQRDIKSKIMLAEETLTDGDIKVLFEQVGCTVKKIVHREFSRDVYYYTPDNRARKDAVDLAYKLRKKIGNNGEDSDPFKARTVNIIGMRIVLDK